MFGQFTIASELLSI